MTLGQRLAFYRKKNCLTQQQLGKMINVSPQAVSKWENDQAEPDVTTICRLSEIYRISTDAILIGSEDITLDSVPHSPSGKRNRRKRIFSTRSTVLAVVGALLVIALTCVLLYIFIEDRATLPLSVFQSLTPYNTTQ